MKVELIIDQLTVASSEGVTFHLNPACKHPENPLLLPGTPDRWDSLQISWPATVLYSGQENKFRCWYSGLDAFQAQGRWWVPGYAESDDGVHWIKPDLNKLGKPNAVANQIRCDWDPYALISTVFANPSPDASESQRFCAYWKEQGFDEQGQRDNHYIRAALAYSPDGIIWERACTAYEGMPFDRPSYQDISQILYDHEEQHPDFRVKGYTQIFSPRSWDDKMVRKIGMVYGPHYDAVKNAEPSVVLEPQKDIDEELHFASVKKVGKTYLMLFESDRFSENPIHGDLRLAVSGDGRNFRRIDQGASLISTGSKGMWDENLLVTTTTSIQEVGDEMYIYYIGCPNVYNSWPIEYSADPNRRGSFFYPTYLGLATLPKDRFAFAAGPGLLTTKPVEVFNGEDIWLNADGNIASIKALDESGVEETRGCLSDERNGTIYRKIIWESPLSKGSKALKITLGAGSKLYSWSIG